MSYATLIKKYSIIYTIFRGKTGHGKQKAVTHHTIGRTQ